MSRNKKRFSDYDKFDKVKEESEVQETDIFESESTIDDSYDPGDDVEELIPEEETDISSDPVTEVLEETISKISAIEEYKEDGVRIPSVLKEPAHLEKDKRKVKSKRLRLREEPSKVGNIIDVLEEGTILTIDKSFKNDNWEKVIDETGNCTGYVMKAFVSNYA